MSSTIACFIAATIPLVNFQRFAQRLVLIATFNFLHILEQLFILCHQM